MENHFLSSHVSPPTAAASSDSLCRSELWACVVCPDLVLHVFSPDGARIYMHELIRVRGLSGGVKFGSWSPTHAGSGAK